MAGVVVLPLAARATRRPPVLVLQAREVLRRDPLVHEEHASPQGGCDLTVNSLELQVNSHDEEKAHGAVCAELQEVSCVRRRETLKLFLAFDS